MEQEKNQLTTQSTNCLATNYLDQLFKDYPKIRALKNFVPIQQAIARCCVLVGIPNDNYPKGIELDVLIEHVCKQYPYHVAPEIVKAFEMAITRSFPNVDYSELLKHYGKFSPEFLSRIMTAYNENERSKVLALQTNQAPLYKEPAFDWIAGYELGLFQKFDKFVADGSFEWNEREGAMYYTSLKELGLLVDTQEQRQQFGAKARSITPRRKPKTLLDKPEPDEDYKIRLLKVAKSLAFRDWIQQHAFEETDIRALVIPELNKKIQASC